MLISCNILDINQTPALAHDMYTARARVFGEIMQWDVTIHKDGGERDQFDANPGLYLLAVDDAFDVQAGMRMLPTTGPYMTADVFQQLLEGKAPLRAPQIWEASRFFAKSKAQDKAARSAGYWMGQAKNPYVAELISGLILLAENAGVTDIVGVFDVAVERFLRGLGVDCHRLGQPQKVGNTRALAGIFEVKRSIAENLAADLGFCLDSLVFDASIADNQLVINRALSARAANYKMAVNG